MSKIILEAAALALEADSRVDAEAGIIHGVKVLGSQSRNGRTYPPALLAQRYAVYEGAQCYADHDYAMLRTGKPRPLGQWGGVLRAVRYRGEGIFADLHCLKATEAGRIILEAAARMPERFGLSPMHLIEAEKGTDGKEIVTAILECLSVDAVTRPATTRTLFEAEEDMPDTPAPAEPKPAPAPTVMSVEAAFLALQNAVMASDDYDDNEKVQVLKDVMKLKSKVLGGGGEEEESSDETPAEESEKGQYVPGGGARQARALDALTAQVRALTIRQMAGESLPIDAPTMQVLLGLPDDNAVAGYLEQLRRARRPRYSSGAPRAVGRDGAPPPAPIPRLSAGADRESVRKFYSGG